jgi:NAD(P)H-dependent FMN reductase
MPRILAFAGSARTNSWNKKLARAAVEIARARGAAVTLVDLREHAMPLYDGDLEAEHGLPEAVQRWKALLGEHDGLLIACPEYNSSITPLLKNAIAYGRWTSKAVRAWAASPRSWAPVWCASTRSAVAWACRLPLWLP